MDHSRGAEEFDGSHRLTAAAFFFCLPFRRTHEMKHIYLWEEGWPCKARREEDRRKVSFRAGASLRRRPAVCNRTIQCDGTVQVQISDKEMGTGYRYQVMSCQYKLNRTSMAGFFIFIFPCSMSHVQVGPDSTWQGRAGRTKEAFRWLLPCIKIRR